MASKAFYAALAAGAAFIAIGIASSIYSNVPVDVPLDNTVKPGMVDVMSPDMNIGSIANIKLNGSTFDIDIMDPDRHTIKSERGISAFGYNFTAQKAGEHRILVNNTGSGDVMIDGLAQTKSGPLALSGALMLAVTGILVIGLSLRFRNR